jgi:Spy/CpxP family protein refolding chaperone
MLKPIVVTALLFGSTVSMLAQTGPPPDTNAGTRPAPEVRQGALRRLGLTQVQLRQIRDVNLERRPRIQAAQARLREANRALDAAIYSDSINETEFEARLKDVQAAHAELLRIRFTNELAIRKVLTPEQLATFRDLRSRFDPSARPRRGPQTGAPAQGGGKMPGIVRPRAGKRPI